MYWANGIAKVLEICSPDYRTFNSIIDENEIFVEDDDDETTSLVEGPENTLTTTFTTDTTTNTTNTTDTTNNTTITDNTTTTATNTFAILRLKRNKAGNLFVTLTKNSLQLWGIRPTALIAQVTRTKKSIEEYGENVDLFWKPDGSLIIVQTSQNCLFTYSVLPFDDKSYKYQFGQISHHYVTGAGEGNGIKTFLLKFRITIRIDAGMEAGIGTDEYLIVTTKAPPAIQCIPWHSEPTATKTNILARLEFIESNKASISHMVYDRRINLYGWITTDGKAYAVQFIEHRPSIEDDSKIPPLYWMGYCFHASGSEIEKSPEIKASCIAINAKFSLLAVGTQGISHMVYDRRINLYGWITTDGKAYAVQFIEHRPSIEDDSKIPPLYWMGYCFHASGSEIEKSPEIKASCIAINAKFSLLAGTYLCIFC
ncbi:hypothetical protein Glove_326g53 [Diversispora epigaea]|uniref:Uncharacterized protein n=1 Tax=Diversispora epigaea TaxID=1348612 RepID=A0A397HLX5_9GLOM|nr:hypothetical protein Glove_326g53 [Diversispora epigaea]